MRSTEINIFYGHEAYSLVTGKQYCDCSECAKLRPEIYKLIWNQIKRKK